MKRVIAAVVTLLSTTGLMGCSSSSSSDKSTDPVKVADGTINGQQWSLVTFKDEAGELCLEVRKPGSEDAYTGACGWRDQPGGGPYSQGSGPAGSEFAFGPLRATVATVQASAPGKKAVTVAAQALPKDAGAAKFFVIPFAEAGTWTYVAKGSSGSVEAFGP